MKNYIIILFLLYGFTQAQGSKFKDLDVIVYPEYYFHGIMVEVNGDVSAEALPLEVDFTVPANTDSVFYVGGADENSQKIDHLEIFSTLDRHYLKLSIKNEKFRLFIFYNIEEDGASRKGSFTFQINQYLENAHLVVQIPAVASNFTFSEEEAQSYTDQHGMEFLRLHLHDYNGKNEKTISFSYDNNSGETSIEQLQKVLSGEKPSTSRNQPQVKTEHERYKLTLWQPLSVLAILAIIIAVLFIIQNKKESSGVKTENFCSACGKAIKAKDKFCGNCGEKI